MPTRMIREGLLESARWWAISDAAARLWLSLSLVADDFGLISLAPLVVRRRCYAKPPSAAKLEKLYEELRAQDLIRIYYTGSAEFPNRYAFLPRFGQKLRIVSARHPMPPRALYALYASDAKAIEMFNKHKDLFKDMPVSRTTAAPQVPGTRVPEVEVEVEGKRREEKLKSAATDASDSTDPTTANDEAFLDFLEEPNTNDETRTKTRNATVLAAEVAAKYQWPTGS